MSKNTLPNTPSDGGDTLQTHVLGTDDDYSMFFRHVNKCAGLTRKDVQYGLRVSATTADKWYSGELKNPLIRAREHVELLRNSPQGGVWVIPSVLEYIAGSNFDGLVFNKEATEALRVIAKAVKE